MRQVLGRPGFASILLLVGLVTLEAVHQSPADVRGRFGRVGVLTTLLHRNDLNREAGEAQTAGYYEGLLNEGSRVSMMSRLTMGGGVIGAGDEPGEERATWMGGRIRRRAGHAEQYRFRSDFLYYEPHPNLDVAEYKDTRLRLVTNSLGFSDREYPRERRQGTRRIALVGDSVSRGMGAPYGTGFEALLEERLNDAHTDATRTGFEILNFAVSGYRITQMFDVAVSRVPLFSPDAYILALSETSSPRLWGQHVATLVREGIDLKYDFLREVVRASGLDARDRAATAEAKLARFRHQAVRRILAELRSRTEQHGAEFVLMLVPTVRRAEALRQELGEVRQMAVDLGIPLVDLLDTFEEERSLELYRVSANNLHPNEHGHRLIAERLYRQILADPALSEAILGRADTTSSRHAATLGDHP